MKPWSSVAHGRSRCKAVRPENSIGLRFLELPGRHDSRDWPVKDSTCPLGSRSAILRQRLDDTIVFNERHLWRILASYFHLQRG